MKDELRMMLPFLIGFTLMSLYQLIKDYVNGAMNIYDVIVNLVLSVICWLIFKDIWKYSEND
ncbi:hypothetical protein [Bacillus xiapuensis]|uniref:VanZ-like domain-containing protein n=1 Tax=Bacillus xiapuensis TaxID=2014075 RepID=A0ABU6N885_9BACI|nr:hypothetical protein [Bacillus xiapuensis]